MLRRFRCGPYAERESRMPLDAVKIARESVRGGEVCHGNKGKALILRSRRPAGKSAKPQGALTRQSGTSHAMGSDMRSPEEAFWTQRASVSPKSLLHEGAVEQGGNTVSALDASARAANTAATVRRACHAMQQ